MCARVELCLLDASAANGTYQVNIRKLAVDKFATVLNAAIFACEERFKGLQVDRICSQLGEWSHENLRVPELGAGACLLRKFHPKLLPALPHRRVHACAPSSNCMCDRSRNISTNIPIPFGSGTWACQGKDAPWPAAEMSHLLAQESLNSDLFWMSSSSVVIT
jgi:hypothetical protein